RGDQPALVAGARPTGSGARGRSRRRRIAGRSPADSRSTGAEKSRADCPGAGRSHPFRTKTPRQLAWRSGRTARRGQHRPPGTECEPEGALILKLGLFMMPMHLPEKPHADAYELDVQT